MKVEITMAKRPHSEFPTAADSTTFHGRVMAFAPHADALLRIQEAMFRFSLNQDQMADFLGFDHDDVRVSRLASSDSVQRRLLEMLSIIDAVETWAGSDAAALEWYRTIPIPALGDDTAQSTVNAGLAGAVTRYIDGIAVGGFA